MGKWLCRGVFVLALGVSWGRPAQAGPIYSFAFEQSSYTVNPGGTVAVRVYLREDVSDGSPTFLKNTGLIGAGAQVNGNNALATVAALPDVQPNLGPVGFFDDANGPATSQSMAFLQGTGAALTEDIGLRPDPVFASGSGPVYQILLGTFTFTAGGIAGDTALTATRRTLGVPGGSGSQDLVGGDFPPTVFDDAVLSGTATVHVTGQVGAVPEPTALTLAGLGALSLLGYR
jgi:hypothetical protein